jgi:hypothetical protein
MSKSGALVVDARDLIHLGGMKYTLPLQRARDPHSPTYAGLAVLLPPAPCGGTPLPLPLALPYAH